MHAASVEKRCSNSSWVEGRSSNELKLAERGRLGARIQGLVASKDVELFTGFSVAGIERSDHDTIVIATDGRRLEVDEVIATTGFRPDLELTRELRLSLDSAVESPTQLAPLIDPNVHSCGSVPPHRATELAHPEKDFYVVGMKSLVARRRS